MCSRVEAEGVRNLQRDMVRATGIIFRANGETYQDLCLRIAGEYGISVETARDELVHFQSS